MQFDLPFNITVCTGSGRLLVTTDFIIIAPQVIFDDSSEGVNVQKMSRRCTNVDIGDAGINR